MVELEDFRAMLIERVEEWNRELKASGEKKGLKKGLKKGMAEGLEKGRQEGLEKGLEKGRRELLLHQLEVKFGQLDGRTRARVSAAKPQRLLLWAERLLTAERLADVFAL